MVIDPLGCIKNFLTAYGNVFFAGVVCNPTMTVVIAAVFKFDPVIIGCCDIDLIECLKTGRLWVVVQG